jgi:nucleoside-diphosphate-sugar epimerase
MAQRRILITGASGCIGHYITETLIQQTSDELFLLVRNPAKLTVPIARPDVHLIQGDLHNLESLRNLLPTITHAVLTATSWGNPQVAYHINVEQTLALIQGLNPDVCERVIYFSTASILGRDGTLLPEAKELGTEYIRSKYLCFEKLSQLKEGSPITIVFPTLVVGGDRQKPLSHVSLGLPEIIRWAGLIRFLRTEGSFHFIHAQDIAQIVKYVIEHPEKSLGKELILGTPALSVNDAVKILGQFTGKTSPVQLNLTPFLINVLVKLFRIQIGAWDQFCLQYRHFNYANAVCPATFGLRNHCSTLLEVMQSNQNRLGTQ